MKLIMLTITIALTFCFSAFAQEIPAEGFEWLPGVISMLQSFPVVGKILAVVFEVLAVASVVLTGLAAFLKTILGISQLAAKWAGAEKASESIKKFEEKILPWIKYFSMYNVQKK